MKRLDLTEIARADLRSIRRYSLRTWGEERTAQSRPRDDLRLGLQMATSGRHCIFFETNPSRILVIRVLHDRMDYRRHLGS